MRFQERFGNAQWSSLLVAVPVLQIVDGEQVLQLSVHLIVHFMTGSTRPVGGRLSSRRTRQSSPFLVGSILFL